MATAIKIGNIIVPILRHITLTGTPASATTGPNLINEVDQIADFPGCTYVGKARSIYNPRDNFYETIFELDDTELNESGHTVYINADGPIESFYTYYAQIRIYRDGTSLATAQNIECAHGWRAPQSTYDIESFTRWGAFSYSYPNASGGDNLKVNGYYIFAIEQLHQWSRTYDNWSYSVRSGITIAIPNINRNLNANITYEEIPIEPPVPDEDPNEDDPDYPSEPSTPDQDHTPIYDPIPIPNLPTLGSAGAGFITMYKLGLAAINLFTNDMFVDSVWEAIKNYFGQPMDFLVGCMLLPFEPETGSSYYPKFGDDIKFEHAYPAVSNQYKEIDCGTVFIKKYWGSCFDYEPFTKIQIWLPYIGYRDLAVDEIMGNAISVKYHCDCLTGDCVAFILDNLGPGVGPTIPRVIAQFYGNCGVRVPFGSVSYDAAVAAGISLIGSAASNALIPGAAPAIEGIKGNGGIIGGASAGAQAFGESASNHSSSLVGSTVNFVQSMKPTVQKGGAAGASNGYMSIQKPYLIRRIPRQNLPADYVKFKGYPSNISGKLADFSGYAEIDDIQLNDIPAMSSERAEIISWLNGGVLI